MKKSMQSSVQNDGFSSVLNSKYFWWAIVAIVSIIGGVKFNLFTQEVTVVSGDKPATSSSKGAATNIDGNSLLEYYQREHGKGSPYRYSK